MPHGYEVSSYPVRERESMTKRKNIRAPGEFSVVSCAMSVFGTRTNSPRWKYVCMFARNVEKNFHQHGFIVRTLCLLCCWLADLRCCWLACTRTYVVLCVYVCVRVLVRRIYCSSGRGSHPCRSVEYCPYQRKSCFVYKFRWFVRTTFVSDVSRLKMTRLHSSTYIHTLTSPSPGFRTLCARRMLCHKSCETTTTAIRFRMISYGGSVSEMIPTISMWMERIWLAGMSVICHPR